MARVGLQMPHLIYGCMKSGVRFLRRKNELPPGGLKKVMTIVCLLVTTAGTSRLLKRLMGEVVLLCQFAERMEGKGNSSVRQKREYFQFFLLLQASYACLKMSSFSVTLHDESTAFVAKSASADWSVSRSQGLRATGLTSGLAFPPSFFFIDTARFSRRQFKALRRHCIKRKVKAVCVKRTLQKNKTI